MGGPYDLDDSQHWLEEALAVVREQDRALRTIAQSVAARLQSTVDDAEAGRLGRLNERLDAAIQQNLSVAHALVPLPRASSAATASAAEGYMAALEEERYRLARDIHDGPAQVLANAILELQYCERLLVKSPSAVGAELVELQASLREGLAEVRRLIFDLRPPALVELGLVASLRRCVEEFRERSGLEVVLHLDETDERLPDTQEAAVFRIVQEALQNVRRHSHCRRVQVSGEAGPDGWRLRVSDDGVGFDTSRGHTGRRTLGLTAMRERAQSIGASLEVTSTPGAGTTVTLTVPRRS